jgi:hypothetical protein
MALSLMKQVANTRFVESAEAHFRMNLDPKYNDQQLRATVPFLLLFYLSLLVCLFVCYLFGYLNWNFVGKRRSICPRGRDRP